MALTTDLAIRKWAPKKDGEAIGTGGRIGLYVRGWRTGAKAFYFRTASKTATWIKLGDYPDVSLATARELSMVASRLAREGFGVDALRRGFANASTATELDAIVRGKMLSGLASSGATTAPTYHDIWREWYDAKRLKLQEGPSRRRPEAIHQQHVKLLLHLPQSVGERAGHQAQLTGGGGQTPLAGYGGEQVQIFRRQGIAVVCHGVVLYSNYLMILSNLLNNYLDVGP